MGWVEPGFGPPGLEEPRRAFGRRGYYGLRATSANITRRGSSSPSSGTWFGSGRQSGTSGLACHTELSTPIGRLVGWFAAWPGMPHNRRPRRSDRYFLHAGQPVRRVWAAEFEVTQEADAHQTRIRE